MPDPDDMPTDAQLEAQNALADKLMDKLMKKISKTDEDYTGVLFCLWTSITLQLGVAGWTAQELDTEHWVLEGQKLAAELDAEEATA